MMFRRFGAGVAAVSAGLLLWAGPASATTVKSPTNAGYTGMSATPITTFTGSIKAPSATCPATGQVDMFMQVLLFGTTGDSVGFEPFFICNNGQLGNYIAEAFVSSANHS